MILLVCMAENVLIFWMLGGSTTKEALSRAFRILKNDQRIRGILINIYGGEYTCKQCGIEIADG